MSSLQIAKVNLLANFHHGEELQSRSQLPTLNRLHLQHKRPPKLSEMPNDQKSANEELGNEK